MKNLKPFTQADLNTFLNQRDGELKLGQTIITSSGEPESDLENPEIKAILLGIPEDIGPRANLGLAGASEAWNAFLKTFLNVQDNKFLSGKKIYVAGEVFTDDLMKESQKLNVRIPEDLTRLRKLVEVLDERVSAIVETFLKSGKLLIVVGGGHNNSYGLLKGLAKSIGKSVNCINLDPHADFRPLEGRHSGNGFSYAKANGHLNKYYVLGLHESYNSNHIIEKAQEGDFKYSTYDSMLRGEISFENAIKDAVNSIEDGPCGIELDLDSIELMPSSATSPSGVSVAQARQFVSTVINDTDARYIHLAEGAPGLHQDGNLIIGKTISYLITDIVKSYIKKDV